MFDIYSGTCVRRAPTNAEAQGHVVCCILLLITRIYCGAPRAGAMRNPTQTSRLFGRDCLGHVSTTSMSEERKAHLVHENEHRTNIRQTQVDSPMERVSVPAPRTHLAIVCASANRSAACCITFTHAA